MDKSMIGTSKERDGYIVALNELIKIAQDSGSKADRIEACKVLIGVQLTKLGACDDIVRFK